MPVLTSSKLLTLGIAQASLALLSLNRNFPDGLNYESFMSSTGSRTRGYSPFGLRVFQTLFLCRYNKTGGLKAPGYLCSRLPDADEW